jgi:fucose 4-O-acetylase-like acetyltransferase
VLNLIGLSIVCMALVGGAVLYLTAEHGQRRALVATAILTSASISLLTPLLWTTWRPRWLPWPLESYINGVHNLGEPQSWLFPIFPWMAFAFAGMATGLVLFSDWAREKSMYTMLLAGAAGISLIGIAYRFDHLPFQLYSVYDYWHTSPNFFLTRVGLLLAIVFLSDAWCRWGLGNWGFSPLIQLGQTSLLVYWVHIEFVYGRLSLLRKRAQGIGAASLGLLAITGMMLALSLLRTRIDWKKVFASVRPPAPEPKPAE